MGRKKWFVAPNGRSGLIVATSHQSFDSQIWDKEALKITKEENNHRMTKPAPYFGLIIWDEAYQKTAEMSVAGAREDHQMPENRSAKQTFSNPFF